MGRSYIVAINRCYILHCIYHWHINRGSPSSHLQEWVSGEVLVERGQLLRQSMLSVGSLV
jgi:hypothetical protein